MYKIPKRLMKNWIINYFFPTQKWAITRDGGTIFLTIYKMPKVGDTIYMGGDSGDKHEFKLERIK